MFLWVFWGYRGFYIGGFECSYGFCGGFCVFVQGVLGVSQSYNGFFVV